MNPLSDFPSLLCRTKARNNEEYRVDLKRQQFLMLLMCLLGISTVAGVYAISTFYPELLTGTNNAFLYGLGTGISLGALVRIFQIFRILKDEARIKRERLKSTDEREIEITNRALHLTAKIIALTLYLLVIFCSFNTISARDLITYLLFFVLLCYIICRKIYEKLM